MKNVVSLARQQIRELFAEEGISDLGLEEVKFDDNESMWRVTIGFSRPWDQPKGALSEFTGAKKQRDYKVVRIADSTDVSAGRIQSVRRLEAGV